MLLFFWLNSIDLAKERVKTRVSEGGHHIDEEVIERRYKRGIFNLFDVYLSIVDEVFVFDNSYGNPELIADKGIAESLNIKNEVKFKQLKVHHDIK